LRLHNYAAHPSEHVAQPSVFTTLFPHLGHAKIHEFRYAFLIGLAVIVVLVATGLVVAALLVSIFLIPTLYLVYLYEAQVYRDEPALVLGATLVGGLVLGLIVTIVADTVVGISTGRGGVSIGYTVVVPLIQLVVMPLPALLLRNRDNFTDTVDGLVFGVAAGLGFAVAEGIVRFSDTFTTLGVRTSSAAWIYPMVSLAVLIPLLHGSAAGAIAASLWRTDRRGRARALGTYGIPIAVIASIAFYYVGALLASNGVQALIVLLYQAIPVGLLLVYIRFLLHHSLLEEAAGLGFVAVVCANCHRHVVAAGFCPNCGVAIAAAPRRAAPQAAGAEGA
jgi:RsiW-degrading membrane proteinase PrsW (M82 family)